MFVGRFAVIDGRPCLVGEFRAPRSTRAFFVFYISFVLLWWIVAIAGTLGSPERGFPLALLLIAPPLMIGVVVTLSRAGPRLAKTGVMRIEAVLRKAVGPEFTVVPHGRQ